MIKVAFILSILPYSIYFTFYIQVVLYKFIYQLIDFCVSGGFMLIRGPAGNTTMIDFRETAPMAAAKDMYVSNPIAAQIGGLSVAIP
jgi:hypothetical protein